VNIVLNGTPREVADGITVSGLVRELARDRPDGRGMAVAVDAAVVPRSAWDAVALSEGQSVEVVGAVQGG
jgi:sulfur carrier protein